MPSLFAQTREPGSAKPCDFLVGLDLDGHNSKRIFGQQLEPTVDFADSFFQGGIIRFLLNQGFLSP
jgi:hypothetical protein